MKNRALRTIISLLLIVVMLFTAVPITASAATSGKCGDNLTWAFNESTGTLTITGTGAMYNYEYPWESYKDSIKSITIGDSVTTIGDYAFGWCESLTSVTIGNGVTTIGVGTFYYCTSLTNITVVADNQYHSSDSYGVLYNKNKTELIQYPIGNERVSFTIPDSVTSIVYYAFNGCENLTSITIPDSVSTIRWGAFAYCDSLIDVYYNGTEEEWNKISVDEENEPLHNATIHFNSSGNYNDVITGFCGDNLTWTFDEATGTLSISGFGEMYDFLEYDCPWENYKEGIKSVVLGKGVSSIGYGAFNFCDKLATVDISNNVTSIGDYSFNDCFSLVNVTIPDGVESIGYRAFSYCESLETVILGKSVKVIGEKAFLNCDSIVNLEIPDCVVTVGAYSFSNCNSLVNLIILDSVTTIQDFAFSWCEKLTSVAIGNGVNSIKEAAFFGCNSLVDVYYAGEMKQWSAISIDANNEPLINANIHFENDYNYYNLGEETYSFDNFEDEDADGHCFGMSITSSGYYLNELDIKDIGLNDSSELYTASETARVTKPICRYQDIQGSRSRDAIVAGGTKYKYGYCDISSDWDAVVNYVKSHKYDNTGKLQIGFRRLSGGHAINFLRYENVNGEDRIYAYDNNYPDTETYFYKGSDGKIYQRPYSTFKGAIDCIALRSVEKYFDLVEDFDSSRVIYGWADNIEVDGVTGYPMDLGDSREYMMYEIPEGMDEVVIVPLTDNATFEYMDEDYQFGSVGDDTYGIFTLSTSENANDESFAIENTRNGIDEVFAYDLDMTYKSYAAIDLEIYADGVDYTVTYSSSDPDVAYVDENGEVYASGEGSADITVTVTDEYGNVVTDTCAVTVSYAWWQWIIRILLLGFLWY